MKDTKEQRKNLAKAMAEKNKPKLGSGKRFSDLVEKLKKKGVKNAAALAAFIGRKRYGNVAFNKLGKK